VTLLVFFSAYCGGGSKQTEPVLQPVQLFHNPTPSWQPSPFLLSMHPQSNTTAAASPPQPVQLLSGEVLRCHTNNLQINTSKTKELVIDFGRAQPDPRPVALIEGEEVEV